MWTCWVPLRKQIQVGVIGFKYCLLFFFVANSFYLSWVFPELPSLIKKKPVAAKKTVCTVALFRPSHIEQIR